MVTVTVTDRATGEVLRWSSALPLEAGRSLGALWTALWPQHLVEVKACLML